MFNSIKLINRAFDKVYDIEKRVNYEFEPVYFRKNRDWKRNLYFDELKNDFIKDVAEFGFCPYIPKKFNDQQKNINISKFAKIDNYSKLDYLKRLYKEINPQEINREKAISNFNKSNNKKINRYSITSMRIRRNKSNIYTDLTKNKKKFFLKKISNLQPKLVGSGDDMKLNLNKNNKNKNIRKNSSMANICYKKDKSVNKSENQYVEAESFVYEPEKVFFKHNQNLRDNNSLEEETTNVPKSNLLINKSQKRKIVKIVK